MICGDEIGRLRELQTNEMCGDARQSAWNLVRITASRYRLLVSSRFELSSLNTRPFQSQFSGKSISRTIAIPWVALPG
jgi:hypothetical protein